jgi:hypothetical protein
MRASCQAIGDKNIYKSMSWDCAGVRDPSRAEIAGH